mmetsp:Transcript_23333/g.36007  ORF Transcript_23333/g.36007 Transcript_23333/m.36007 type:complete len:300 (-) Transcript_23333:554-1453(-)
MERPDLLQQFISLSSYEDEMFHLAFTIDMLRRKNHQRLLNFFAKQKNPNLEAILSIGDVDSSDGEHVIREKPRSQSFAPKLGKNVSFPIGATSPGENSYKSSNIGNLKKAKTKTFEDILFRRQERDDEKLQDLTTKEKYAMMQQVTSMSHQKGIKSPFSSPDKRAMHEKTKGFDSTYKKYERLFDSRKKIEQERDFFRPPKVIKKPEYMQKYRVKNHFDYSVLRIQLWWKRLKFEKIKDNLLKIRREQKKQSFGEGLLEEVKKGPDMDLGKHFCKLDHIKQIEVELKFLKSKANLDSIR